jgi:hypothetical protein
MATLGERGTRAVGIAWMREEDYPTLVRIFEDGDMFTDGWEAWNKRAEALEDRMKSEGVIVLRAYLDSETFADWCTVRGLNPDREGRLAFGVEFAAEQYGRDQS